MRKTFSGSNVKVPAGGRQLLRSVMAVPSIDRGEGAVAPQWSLGTLVPCRIAASCRRKHSGSGVTMVDGAVPLDDVMRPSRRWGADLEALHTRLMPRASRPMARLWP